MKYLFFLLTFCAFFKAPAQTKVLQFYDYIYQYNSATVTLVTNCVGSKCFNSLISTDTIARLHDNGIVYWKATLSGSNINDTLSASGITGICRITVPTTFSTQRVIQIRDIAIIYASTIYDLTYAGSFYQFPITIIKLSDNSTVCTIYESGVIDWTVTPQYSWLGRVGITRIKRITLP